jgi:oligopeptide/dipeptide ABC transporter ATP-binding protein
MSEQAMALSEPVDDGAGQDPGRDAADVVLSVSGLTTTFLGRGGPVTAVRGVDFQIRAGETFVLLGESGSGKSVTARSILGLHGGRAAVTGQVMLGGRELLGLDPKQMRGIRGSELALVPQDPNGSLDPLRRVGHQLVEVLRLHGVSPDRAAARTRALELLGLVGIPDPPRVARSYPHELSGGMRQRVVIAIAVSCQPRVLIADEPTTALDVTVQAQILSLFADLQRQLRMALLLVTHDVGVTKDIADSVGVMYAGRLVEHGPAGEVLGNPRHPYTEALLAALPTPATRRGELKAIVGSPPLAGTHFDGCAFAERCGYAVESCHTGLPPLVPVASGHFAACPVRNLRSERVPS